jgi:hypothetical protein
MDQAKAIEIMQGGADGAVRVGSWVRSLAVEEAQGGGAFGDSITRHDSAAWAGFAREVFGSLYGLGVEAVEGSSWAREILSQAESLPEWRALQARAEGDSWACGLAASQALDVLAPISTPPSEDAAQAREKAEALREALAENPTSERLFSKLSRAIGDLARAEKSDEDAAAQARESAAKIRSALRRAAASASEAVDEAQEALAGLGCSKEPGSKGQGKRPEAVAALRGSAKLRRIARLAGRLKAQAIAKQSTKADHGREELCDVECGDDLGRLLPSESVFLADSDLEAVLFRRLLERSALQYRLRGRDVEAQGPIVVAIDESGSMQGSRDEWAKAVALALLEIAQRQNRAFAVVPFSGKVGAIAEFRTPKSASLEEILSVLGGFMGGGTAIGAALAASAGLISADSERRLTSGSKAWKKADVILITDGVDHDLSGISLGLDRVRDSGATLHAIAIGCDLGKTISDRAASTTRIDHEDLGGASPKVDAVFSI